MEQAVVQVVVIVLSKFMVLRFNCAFRCLLVSDEVHQVPLSESLLVLHVVANPLHRGIVIQITVLGKRCSKGSLASVEQLRVRKSVLVLYASNQCCGWPSLHKLLAKSSNLAIFVD